MHAASFKNKADIKGTNYLNSMNHIILINHNVYYDPHVPILVMKFYIWHSVKQCPYNSTFSTLAGGLLLDDGC